MSARVSGVGMPDRHGFSAAVDLDGSHTKDLKSAQSAKTQQMAQEFEAMFLRQILTSAKIGGASKAGGGGDGYQSMGVDALATTISKSGGIGLAKQIEDIVGRTEHRIIDAKDAAGGATATATATTPAPALPSPTETPSK